MVLQAWSAGTLCYSRTYNIGASSHLILDPTLCWTRVEDIYLFISYYSMQISFVFNISIIISEVKGDWDFRITDLVKTLMELIFNPCGEFWWSPEGPVSQVHSPHLDAGAPGIFSDFLRSVQMVKRMWIAESNRKLPHLFIPSKTAILVPTFAVGDLPLGRTLWWWWWCM